jgi:hypothetical protein
MNLKRLMDKVSPEPNTGCWLWTGSYVGRMGYGYLYDPSYKRMRLAHRVSYELHRGPIPEGMQIDHLCRVAICVNPSHLEVVTSAENTRRGNAGKYLKDRTACPKGHAYDAINTYVYRGFRYCRKCNNLKGINRRAGRSQVCARALTEACEDNKSKRST